MSCDEIETWYRGETTEFVLTAVFGGQLRDLREFTGGIELQVKRNLDDPDPALVVLAVDTGIVLRDQDDLDDGLGKADVTIESDAWDDVEAGYVWYDVFGLFAGSPPVRKLIVVPTRVLLAGVCNTP